MRKIKWFILLIFFLFLLLFFSELGKKTIPQYSTLQVKNRDLIVQGKKAQVFEISQPNGVQGLILKKGDRFRVILENQINEPTGVHWHGILLPNNQDGVPFVTQYPIPPGGKYEYDFPINQSGTYWMHSHYGLQEQKLLAAPLIIHDPSEQNTHQQEIVMFLSDFTFRQPLEIFKELRNKESLNTHKQHQSMKMDLNDVKYDAFLTNWRTLENPDVIQVDSDKEIRLRIINGSSSTNFMIYLGKLKGEVIAVDGSDIHPFPASQLELAVAQRIDVLLKIPSGNGTYPIIAKGEGLKMETGLILATNETTTTSIQETSDYPIQALSYRQEFLLSAKSPLPKKEINRRLILNLEGDMDKYIWLLNGKAWPNNEPLMVKEGERVELTFDNRTMMAHPMHLHGHFFQITEIDGKPLNGALRDTILVLPKSIVKVQFDATNPGIWPLHCHNLYHQYAGMMTTLNYEDFKGPVLTKKEPEPL